MLKLIVPPLLTLLAAGCGGVPVAAGQNADLVRDGRAIAETQCSRCHAVGAGGASPRADAPVFRHVLSRYQAEPLSDALIAGIKVGHPDMPLFEMTPQGADSLIAYLRSIQSPPDDAPPRP